MKAQFFSDLKETRPSVRKVCRLLYPPSWGPKLSPYAGAMSAVIADWLISLNIIQDGPTRQLYEEERADLYGGYPYSSASFDRLIVASKFLVLWIPFDDIVTEGDRDYWRRSGLSIHNYGEALRGGELAPNADRFLRAWWEIGQSFVPTMSQRWRDRLAHGFQKWLEYTVREHEIYEPLRHQDKLPDLSTYIHVRTVTVGADATFDLIEYVEGFELPEKAKTCGEVNALHALAIKIIFLVNDIFSLEKDLEANWPNIVTVIRQQFKLGLFEALEAAVDLHNESVSAFLDLERSLPSFGPGIDSFLQSYVSKLHFVIRGLTEFQLHAERYRWKEQLAPERIRHRITVASFSDPE